MNNFEGHLNNLKVRGTTSLQFLDMIKTHYVHSYNIQNEYTPFTNVALKQHQSLQLQKSYEIIKTFGCFSLNFKFDVFASRKNSF